MKTILLIAHPGHELRISSWVKKYRPEVIMLTQGDGAVGQPRLADSQYLLNKMGVNIRTDWLQPVEDKYIYRVLLGHETSPLSQWLENLYQHLKQEEEVLLVADEAEGYNPTHEVCRILANKLAYLLEASGVKVNNLEFPLVGHPCPKHREAQLQIKISLTEGELKNKIEEGLNYARGSSPQLLKEINEALAMFGESVFSLECLYKAQTTIYETGLFADKKPYFEKVGEQRLEQGVYSEVIRAVNLYQIAKQLG